MQSGNSSQSLERNYKYDGSTSLVQNKCWSHTLMTIDFAAEREYASKVNCHSEQEY